MFLGTTGGLHHGHPTEGIVAHIEHHRVPVGGHDPIGPPCEAPSPEIGTGVAGRRVGRQTGIGRVDQDLSAQPGEKRPVGTQVVVLEVDGGQPQVRCRQTVAVPHALHNPPLGYPVHLACQ